MIENGATFNSGKDEGIEMLFEFFAVAKFFEVYDAADLLVLLNRPPLNGLRIAYTMITSGALMNIPRRHPEHGSSGSLNQASGRRTSSYDWSSAFRGGSQDRDDHQDATSRVGEQLQAAMSVAAGAVNINGSYLR